MTKASFLTLEDNDDLTVSFALPVADDPADVNSLTLLRTPIYEFLLDDDERGVHVFDDDFDDEEDNCLKEIEVGKDVVRMITSYRSYTIDVTDVVDDEKELMKKILTKMNFDRRFILKIV
jgi:hypothetical protein